MRHDRFKFLDSRMSKLARLLSSRYDVRVKLKGAAAFVDLKNNEITLPSLTDSLIPTECWDGFLDHEVAHVKFTNPKIVPWIEKTVKKDPLTKELWNAIEDGHIEQRMGDEFPGCRTNLNVTRTFVMDRDDEKYRKGEEMTPAGKFMNAVLHAVHDRNTIDFEADPDIGELYKEAKPVLAKLGGQTNSFECRDLAIELRAFLDDLAEQEPEQGEDSDDESGKGDKGEDSSDQSKEGGGDGDAESKPEQGQGSGGGERKSAAQAAKEIIEGDAPNSGLQDKINEMIQAKIDEISMDWSGPDDYLIYTEENDKETFFSITEREAYGERYNEEKAEVAAFIGTMGRQLKLALAAMKQTHLVPAARKGRRFDIPQVGRWMHGSDDDRIYRRFETSVVLDTAVTVLFDCSGSMGASDGDKTRIEVARLAAIAFHEALDHAGVKHEILAFDSGQDHSYRGSVPNEEIYSRVYETCNRYVLVPSGSSDGRAIMHMDARSANRDGESVLWAAKRLAKQNTARHVLIVCSDGRPAGSRYHRTECRYLKQVVNQCVKSGIEVYGVGILTDHVEDYYPESVVVKSAKDLPSTLISLLNRSLVEQRGQKLNDAQRLEQKSRISRD